MLKRKFDEQNSDEAMQDSQRTAVPSISPSLDGDDGVSDSSVSSTDSLKTRIRKLSAANRKKKESSENNWRVPSTSKLGFDFQRNPHLMRPILIKYGPETPKARYEAIDESKISFERFRILDTLCRRSQIVLWIYRRSSKI
ncbi:hypothetical protein TNCV_291721 [Trichonephila clavipes]|nr:hypothetical protein TNCV_291721 [Trichonephila clavipes]